MYILSILTFLTARSCEPSWAPATPSFMVTGHPGLAPTPLGTGSTVGPREAGCGMDTHIYTQSVYSQVQSSLRCQLHSLAISLVLYSRLSHLAPLQPGSHSQWPVTWWQLELWTQSHLCSQPSPKNPLEQASDKTHKHSCSATLEAENNVKKRIRGFLCLFTHG